MALVIEIREKEILFLQSRSRSQMSGRLDVLNIFRFEIQNGFIDNDFDFDNAELRSVILEEFKNREIAERFVTVILNNSFAITKELHIPKASKRQMISIARNELNLKLDLPFNYVVDVVRLETVTVDGKSLERVLAVAVAYENISKIEKWTESFGIKLKSIDSAPSSMIAALSGRRIELDEAPRLFLDLGAHYVRFFLFHGPKFIKIRSISQTSDFNTTWERISSFLQMTNIIVNSGENEDLSEIVLMGEEDKVKAVGDRIREEIHLPYRILDIDKIFLDTSDEYLSYLNAAGTLL